MRRFSKLFTGQAAPALNALRSALLVEEENEDDDDKGAADVRATLEGLRVHDGNSCSNVGQTNNFHALPPHAMKPVNGSSSTYRQALTFLESSDFAGNSASESWAALSR